MSTFLVNKRPTVEVALALASMLKEHPRLHEQWQWITLFYAQMTNPTNQVTVLDFVAKSPEQILAEPAELSVLMETLAKEVPPERGIHLFLPSASKETALIDQLKGLENNTGHTMERVIEHVRSRRLKLSLSDDSGLYDRQQNALEPFLTLQETIEGRKLFPSTDYEKRLEMAFASMFAANRETHVKVLM